MEHIRKTETKEYILYEKVSCPAGTVTSKRKSVKIGRNEKCSCGSGKKYKRCCLGK